MKMLLNELYMISSKHSNYQKIPSNLIEFVEVDELVIQSRYEEERWDYIKKHVHLPNQKILDVGGNIGYFTFESIKEGASHVDYFEGNKAHADFVREGTRLLKCEGKIDIFNQYFMFDDHGKKYDVAYVLNVVHHFGDDFGNTSDVKQAKEEMLAAINHMSDMTEILVFQMGYNWCGNRNRCLFENGTKQEMEDFLCNGLSECWEILHIGIAEKEDGKIIYREMNEQNNTRQDALGEFLNRPIFILKSKHTNMRDKNNE